jgi:hypothetical protein
LAWPLLIGGSALLKRLVVPLLAIALLAPAAPAEAAGFVARLSTPGAHPRANHPWTITVTARSPSGKPLRATAFYRFMFQGQVVSTQFPSPHGPNRHTPWPFTGSYRDPILWPSRSVGVPLTFRVVVRVKGKGTVNLDKRVRVRR